MFVPTDARLWRKQIHNFNTSNIRRNARGVPTKIPIDPSRKSLSMHMSR